MHECKLVNISFPFGTKLSLDMFPNYYDYFDDMPKVHSASAAGILMYVIVYTRPNIAQAMGILSRFMSNLGKEH